MAGCASGAHESQQAARMRLYRKYYNELTPAQRQEFLSGSFKSPDEAELRLKSYTKANRSEASLIGVRDQKTAELEQTWSKVEKFLADADKRAADPRQRPKLLSELNEHEAALKRCEGRIRHTPYSAAEQSTLLQRNSYYASRLQAMKNIISKSE